MHTNLIYLFTSKIDDEIFWVIVNGIIIKLCGLKYCIAKLLDHAKGVTWEFHNSNPHKPTSLKSQTFIEIMPQPLIGEELYNDEVWNLLFIYFWVNEFRPFWNLWSLKGSFFSSWSQVHWCKIHWLFKEATLPRHDPNIASKSTIIVMFQVMCSKSRLTIKWTSWVRSKCSTSNKFLENVCLEM